MGCNVRNEIFISHRSEDAPVAEMIRDYLVGTGIPNERIFCSSLPGNDVRARIDSEVKSHLVHASIIILLLSRAYYESAYCLNESGVAWYIDEALTIPIGLPEIDQSSMVGFLSSDYKLRRLDDDNDIAYYFDEARKRLGTGYTDHIVVNRESRKLKERFHSYITSRVPSTKESAKYSHMSTTEMPREADMTNEASIMLLYAAEGDGEIIVSTTFGGSTYQTGGKYNMNNGQEPRELAKWDAAVQGLQSEGYIILSSNEKHNIIYKVTHKGYTFSDEFKKAHRLDTRKTPAETFSDLLKYYKLQDQEQEEYTQEIENYLSF